MDKLFTIPNILCIIRLIGSPFLIVLAWADMRYWCLGLFLFLLLTDWLDGKLAIWLNQQTDFGTRLDSFADVTFYGCSLVAAGVLQGEVLLQEAIWITLALATYIGSLAASWLKFGLLPSYHTRMAKISWGLVGMAFVAMFAGWSIWFLRLAAAGVILTNLEATIITLVSSQPRLNMLSLFHALQAEKKP